MQSGCSGERPSWTFCTASLVRAKDFTHMSVTAPEDLGHLVQRPQSLFVGVRVSGATANALAGAAETLARRGRDAGIEFRWVAPASYHITLKYLGWTRTDAIGAVVD